MLPKLDFTENEEQGYYTTFDKLFPNFTPYLQKDKQDLTIEINFNGANEDTGPSEAQIAAHEFLIVNGDQMLKVLVAYLKGLEEYFMDFYGVYAETYYESKGYKGKIFKSSHKGGFPAVNDVHELINYFGIGIINISSSDADGVACIGFTGGCTWDQEHGFGAAFHKLELLEVGDYDIGSYAILRQKKENIEQNPFVRFYGMKSLAERRERLAKESESIQVENPEAHEEIFDWLVGQKMIYGYRNSPIDLNIREKAVILNEIRELFFHSHDIESIPSSIQLLKNLTKLSFSHNKLVAIPIEICKLSSLKSLAISSNLIERIPKQIGMLSNLEILSLNRNKLTFVTDKIGQLTKLKKLDVSSNELKELPKSILSLTHLEKLYLNTNAFVNFPEDIVNLKSLKTLHIIMNNTIAIPEDIGQLQQLEQFDIRFNQLTMLPDALFINMPNLKWLQVNVNQFDVEYLEGLKQLAPDGMKTDLDSAISTRKDTLRRQKLDEEKKQKQQESQSIKKQVPQTIKKQAPQRTPSPKTVKKNDKKWWEFWRK